MKLGKTKINLIYSITHQLLILLQPLIITPYISRALGADGIGEHSFSFAIAQYFVLITMLGLSNFGNRSIARIKENKEQLSQKFSNLFSMQVIMGIFSIISYLLIVVFGVNNPIFWIQTVFVISSVFDITWFFFGMEEFKIVVTRNTAVRILTIISILVFVNEEADLWKYTLIMALGFLLSNISLWPTLKKHIHFSKPQLNEILLLFKPNLLMFIPVISVGLYKHMNRIILGSVSTMTEVGLFENATRLTSLPLVVLISFSKVMLPKMSNMATKESNGNGLKNIIGKSMVGVMFFTNAAAFGLALIAEEFAPLFFGLEFERAGVLITYLAPMIIFVGWANIIRTQYLIPYMKENVFVVAMSIGAALNIALSLLLIPIHGAMGAVIAIVVTELFVALYQTWAVRKELPFGEYFKKSLPFFFSGIVMYGVGSLIFSQLEINGWIAVIFKALVSVIVYFGIIGFYYIKIKKVNIKELLTR